MNTLWRYVGTRFLFSFVGSGVILALVVLVVDTLLNLDEILEAQDSVVGPIEILLLRIAANYLPYLIPAAAFTGAFLATGLAARSREVVAMKAGGVAPLRAMVPVFAIAVAIALFALALGETITIKAAATLSRRLDGEASDISLRSGTIWYHTGRFVYNIRDVDPDTQTVHDVRIFERDETGRLVRLIQAAEATRLAPHRWIFRAAAVRDFDPAQPDAPPALRLAPEMELELAEDRNPGLLQAELSTLPLWSLASYVGAILEDGGDPRRARSILHERMTRPLLVILFAVLAVPLGLRVEQTRSLALPALHGVILLFFFLLLREYTPTLAPASGSLVAVAPWSVLGVFFGYGVWQLARVPQ